MKQFIQLPKIKPGDQVGVISPSAGLPELFPWVFDLGLERLKDIYGLNPVEYPTTRKMNSSLEDRARDIMAAFADKNNKAIFTSTGGWDQLELIKLLDKQVFLDNPKPFFGYSDNTHLHLFLWNLGIPSYYGGSVMMQLGMHAEMHEMTKRSLQTALFEPRQVEIKPSEEFTDIGINWADKDALDQRRQHEKNDGWHWDGDQNASGILWGGCVESLILQFTSGRHLPEDSDLDGAILFIETAEDIPESWLVEYLLVGMGERGYFDRFQAVLVGRPKTWEFDKQNNPKVRQKHKEDQRAAVIKSVRKYNTQIPIVQNLDFGHTDPQTILPMGRKATLDSGMRSIVLEY